MIGPLLRVAASAAAARSLRVAAREAATRAMLTVGAAVAIGVGVVCLTCAAYILIARNLDDPAAAWAIVGAFWGLAGLIYFAAARRRRG